MNRRWVFSICCTLLIGVPVLALANPYDDLVKVRAAFDAAKSWHAVEQLPDGKTVTVDYVGPDRWRVVNAANFTDIIVGSKVFIVQNGRSTALPFGGGMVRKAIDNFRIMPYPDDVKQSARDLGMRNFNGRMLHAYAFQSGGTPVTIYAGANHVPVQNSIQMKNGTLTITYSQWNAPISIDTP